MSVFRAAIKRRKLFQPSSPSYALTVFFKRMTKSSWVFQVVFTKNTRQFLKRVKIEACFESWKRIEPVKFLFDPAVNEVTLVLDNDNYELKPMINPFQINKRVVDRTQPDSALCYLKFEVFLKNNQEVTDLELTFKGMRDETPLVISSYDLQYVSLLVDSSHFPLPQNPYQLLPHATSTTYPVSSTLSTIDPSSQPNIPNELLCKIPKKMHLMMLLHPIKYMWNTISEQLEVRYSDIPSAEYNLSYDYTRKLSEVLQVWIDKRTCEVSWRKIITVVEEPPIDNKIVADNIYQFLSRPDIQNEYLSPYHQTGSLITTFNLPPPIPIKPPNMKAISQEDSTQIEQTNEPNLISDFPVVDQQYFHEALNKSGAVKTRISKAIVQGPARAGKTSVKSLILSQPYKSKVSTGCCESPDIAVGEFSVSCYGQQEDEYHWELVDSEAMIEKFSSEIRDLMSQRKKKNTVESSHNSKEIKELPVDDQTSYTADTPDDDLKPLSSSKLSHPAKESVAAARVGEMELIHMVNKAQGKHGKLTFHKEWLYFIDCGGQIQFQQLIQAFIPCASVVMLVTSLAENLSNQCSASFEYEEDKSYDVSDYLPSIETLLRHLTLMVSSSSFQQELVGVNELSDVIKIPKKLKVLIVATHRDLYEERLRNGERMETIDEKEEKLEQIFMHIEDNLVFLNEKIFFEVDGRKASQEVFDDPAIKEIRAELRDQAFEVDIPLSWYAFEILLRERSNSPKGCGVLSLKDCETIGFSLSLKKEEIQSALKFFHLLNTILYYPGVSDLVFINPHCLIEVIRELVVFVCESRRHVKAGRGTAECRKVVEQGKISKNVLNIISKKCSQISNFFPDHNFSLLLLRIFKHLLIATERPNKKKFFMPALLPLTDPSQSIPSSHFSLLLYFKKGVPLGLFCAMIVNLLLLGVDNSVDCCDDFVWSIDRTSTMFSNLITLQHYDMKGKVVFVESNDSFEIHFQYAEDKEKGEKEIYSTLNDTIKKRKFDCSKIKYKKASFCPCPKKSRHAAILHTSGKVRCSISGNLLIDPDRQSDTASSKVMTTPSTTRLQTSSKDQPLEDTKSPDVDSIVKMTTPSIARPQMSEEYADFQQVDIMKKVPDHIDLLNLLAKIRHKWYELGLSLRVEKSVLESSLQASTNEIKKLDKVLTSWRDTKLSPVTWENIIESVKGPIVEDVPTAETICKYLTKPEVYSKYQDSDCM